MLGNSITDGGEFSELFGIHNIKPRHILGRDHRCRETPGSGSPPDIRLKYSCLSASTTCRTDTASPRSQSALCAATKKIREQSPDTRLYIQSVMPIDNDYRRYKGLFGRENHQGFQCQGSKRSQRGTEPNTSTSGRRLPAPTANSRKSIPTTVFILTEPATGHGPAPSKNIYPGISRRQTYIRLTTKPIHPEGKMNIIKQPCSPRHLFSCFCPSACTGYGDRRQRARTDSDRASVRVSCGARFLGHASGKNPHGLPKDSGTAWPSETGKVGGPERS